jgi:hypothetical protein
MLLEDIKQYKTELSSESTEVNSKIRSMSYNYYNIMLLKAQDMISLQKSNDNIRGKYNELSSNLSMFLKRHLYSEQKKQEIETKTKNLKMVKDRMTQIKSSVELFDQISVAVSAG